MAATSPPIERPPATLPASAIEEPRSVVFTLEHLLYVCIGVLSVVVHLALLGDRALHHDETLHAYYSWSIYQGRGYSHDPLLHGPFLYYITALTYALFGDSDVTARLSAAIFGIALTLLPGLLRKDIGRGAALLACAYLLVSPVALYVGRFIRHDIYAVVFELLSVIAIVRYAATERPGWHYLLAAAMGLMLVTIETFFLFLLIAGSFVVLWSLWEIARRALALLAAWAAVAVVALRFVPRWAGPLPLPSSDQALLVRHRPDNNWGAYLGDVAGVVGPMLRHPAVALLLLASLALLAGLIWLLWIRKDATGRSVWRNAAATLPAGSLGGAIARIPARQWAIAFGIAFAIYAVFFTAVLSSPTRPNTTGLITGVLGSLLYWLGQHGVQRGNQPPHYYLWQLSVYEPLVLLGGIAGIGLVLGALIRAVVGARAVVRAEGQTAEPGARAEASTAHTAGPPAPMATIAGAGLAHAPIIGVPLAPALLAWWSLGALALYSWAGEKMPWLTIYSLLPLALLSAWAVQQLWNWATAQGLTRRTLSLTGLGGAFLVLFFNRLNTAAHSPTLATTASAWVLLMLGTLLMLALGLGLLYRSARPAAAGVLCLVLGFGFIFTLRASFVLNFRNGDVPVEPLVFVQTSPDVVRVMDRLRDASVLRTGGLDMPIRYDNETIWQWYLRNYSNKDPSGSTQLGPLDEDVQAVFMLSENVAANEADLTGFARQSYPLRWWLPECEVYRLPASDTYCGSDPTASSLLSRVLRRPWDGQAVADYWRFWYDRQLPAPLGSSDWTLFVRPELAAELGINGSSESP